MTPGRVVVVGLGPAGTDLLTPRARTALDEAEVCFVRTERHPTVEQLRADGVAFAPLDHHYEQSEGLDEAYGAIVAEVVAAAREHGHVVYAVPGNPSVAERTVAMLGERAAAGDIDVEIVPGLSFAELVWPRVGLDAMAGRARIVDGRSLDREVVLDGGPLLIAQCDSARVLSDVKLALLDEVAPDHLVTVLQRLGLPDERVETVAVADLDRDVTADHLTSVFVDLGESATAEFGRFVALIERLRGPGGCPWDAEQTHHSLVRHLVEETYEVVDALEQLPADAPGGRHPVPEADYAHLEEELGDLTAQVVFHATLAREEQAFTIADVLRGIREKLVYRHPHVFGDTEVEGAAEVTRNWEQLKREERHRKQEGRTQPDGEHDTGAEAASLVDDVPASLPGLLHAHKLFRKAEAAGIPLLDAREAAAAVESSAGRLRSLAAEAEANDGGGTAAGAEFERVLGDLLATVALLARNRGVDAERALRGWARRFRGRFRAAERLAAERGSLLDDLDGDAVAALWIEAAGSIRPE